MLGLGRWRFEKKTSGRRREGRVEREREREVWKELVCFDSVIEPDKDVRDVTKR